MNIRLTTGVRGLCVGALFSLCAANVSAVSINGLDWRQVTETTNITWEQMAAKCDLVTGECAGSVAGVSVDGWTWADSVDIAGLFETVTGAPAGTFDDPPTTPVTSYSESVSTWAPAFIDIDGLGSDTGYFDPTSIQIGHSGPSDDRWSVNGFTRDLLDSGQANRSYIKDTTLFGDQAIVGNPVNVDAPRAANGFWMYKTVSVPAPSGVLILMAGLIFGVRIFGTRAKTQITSGGRRRLISNFVH